MRTLATLGRLLVAFSLALSACDRGATSVEGQNDEPGVAAAANMAVKVPLIGAKIKGDEKALVTIVEFSDYACPFCKKAHGTVEALLKEYDGKVRLAVFENPLPFHSTAKSAAKWAFAAGEQGKYWQARDVLFEHQKNFEKEGLDALTNSLGLDAERMERDQNSGAAEAYVEAGLGLAKSLEARGTPTFFINGVRLTGAQPAPKFRAVIDEALRSAEGMVAKGTRPENVYSEILANAAAKLPEEKVAPGPAHGGGCECDQGEACDETAKQDPKDSEVYDVQVGDAPTRGDAHAPITIVVYTDFECPFCAKVEERVHELEKEYGSKIRIAYKSFPLPFHEHAELAAKAALAAHKQGKFFEYRDVLFAHQNALERADLLKYAQDVGLDAARFERDIDDKSIEATIAADRATGSRIQVLGTPTFFVNGHRLAGAQPLSAFRTEINAQLAKR